MVVQPLILVLQRWVDLWVLGQSGLYSETLSQKAINKNHSSQSNGTIGPRGVLSPRWNMSPTSFWEHVSWDRAQVAKASPGLTLHSCSSTSNLSVLGWHVPPWGAAIINFIIVIIIHYNYHLLFQWFLRLFSFNLPSGFLLLFSLLFLQFIILRSLLSIFLLLLVSQSSKLDWDNYLIYFC